MSFWLTRRTGGVVIQCKGQYLYGNIAQMAPAIGLPKEKVRIIGNPAGGSFGYSMSPGNTALAAACALALVAAAAAPALRLRAERGHRCLRHLLPWLCLLLRGRPGLFC